MKVEIIKMIQTLTFMFGSIGACCMILTALSCLKSIFKYIDSISKDTNKALIKDTIKEIKNKDENK